VLKCYSAWEQEHAQDKSEFGRTDTQKLPIVTADIIVQNSIKLHYWKLAHTWDYQTSYWKTN